MLGLLVTHPDRLALRRSPLYPVLLAIRDAEPFAAAAGARTALVKIGDVRPVGGDGRRRGLGVLVPGDRLARPVQLDRSR